MVKNNIRKILEERENSFSGKDNDLNALDSA